VLVIDDASRLVEDFPSALPSHKTQVCVFVIKRLQDFVKAAQFEKFVTIVSARSAAAVKARERLRDLVVDAMCHPEAPLSPPALRKAGFFAALLGIGKKDLARNRKNQGVGKRLQQRRQKVAFHPHVAVQQDDDVVLGFPETEVRSSAETQISVATN